MTLSIKGGGGIINEVPKVSDLKVTTFEQNTIDIEYKVEDAELTICRHYLLLNGAKIEITKQVGYESSTNIFKYRITGLKMNTPYIIQIAASDGHDEGLSKAIQQTTKKTYIYGVRVMENNTNPESCVTYIEQAVGTTPANSTSLGGWEDKWPFNKVRMVGFKNGKVTKEINPYQKLYYKEGSAVQHDEDVMVEIPKVYWNFSSLENGYDLKISNEKIDDTWGCYAHEIDGMEKDNIYIGAYLGYNEGGKLRSISGVIPSERYTLEQFREFAQSVGEGYQRWNWHSLQIVQILYLIAYKNLDSQTSLGFGYIGAENVKSHATGGTNKKGLIFGDAIGKEQMCFLGIEDLWGNHGQLIDGIIHNNSWHLMVTSDNKNFNNTANGYKDLGKYVNTFIIGQTSKVAHTNEGGFFPKEMQASYTTNYCDGGRVNKNTIGWSGGHLTAGNIMGIFSFYFDGGMSYSSSLVSSRLCYLG